MSNINSRKEIEKRNETFFKETLNLSLEEYLKKMIRAGKAIENKEEEYFRMCLLSYQFIYKNNMKVLTLDYRFLYK